jgi:hypothetical protein
MDHCPDCGVEYDSSLSGCPECAARAEIHVCARCAERYVGSTACLACGTLRVPAECDGHPGHEAIGCCVVCSRALCVSCATDDHRVYRCADHRDVRVIEGWAQVYSTARDFDAWLVRESLRAEGIDAQIYSQRDRTFSVELGELSIVRLLVPVWEYETARELIRSQQTDGAEQGTGCATCGEPNEPGAGECRSCGAPLDGATDD